MDDRRTCHLVFGGVAPDLFCRTRIDTVNIPIRRAGKNKIFNQTWCTDRGFSHPVTPDHPACLSIQRIESPIHRSEEKNTLRKYSGGGDCTLGFETPFYRSPHIHAVKITAFRPKVYMSLAHQRRG